MKGSLPLKRNLRGVDLALVAYSLLFVVLVALLIGCGLHGDPMLDDMYTQNVYPGTAGDYSIGSEDLPYGEGWFDELYVTGDAGIDGSLSVGTELLIRSDGTISPVEMANDDALPNSLYFSTDNSTLVYKDSLGAVHALY